MNQIAEILAKFETVKTVCWIANAAQLLTRRGEYSYLLFALALNQTFRLQGPSCINVIIDITVVVFGIITLP